MIDRVQTEAEAERIRSELGRTLAELDRRRLLATNVKYQVATHWPMALISAGALLVLAVGTAFAVRSYQKHAQERLRRDRKRAAWRAWTHPKRVAASQPIQPELGKKVLLAVAGAVASRAASAFAASLIPRDQQRLH
jgi:hypothetical protein